MSLNHNAQEKADAIFNELRRVHKLGTGTTIVFSAVTMLAGFIILCVGLFDHLDRPRVLFLWAVSGLIIIVLGGSFLLIYRSIVGEVLQCLTELAAAKRG
jgi:hypothetical protein